MIYIYPEYEPYKRPLSRCKNPIEHIPSVKGTISCKSSVEDVVILLRKHNINARVVTNDLAQVKCNEIISNVKIIEWGRIRWGCAVSHVDWILRENQ